jgi:hypothetical protein
VIGFSVVSQVLMSPTLWPWDRQDCGDANIHMQKKWSK